jgi:hypothetical protein
MTESKFKLWYKKKYNMNNFEFKEFMSENEALPCTCEMSKCKGWIMVSNHILFYNNKIKSNHFIDLHMKTLNKNK